MKHLRKLKPDEKWDLINKKTFLRSRQSHCTLYKVHRSQKKTLKRWKGSITLEAAVSLPIFLIAVAHFLLLITFTAGERELSKVVNEKARKLAAESFIKEPNDDTLIEVYKGNFLRGSYYYRLGRAREFNGRYYASTNYKADPENTLVFVTKNGTVYHQNALCSHIHRTLKEVDFSQRKKLRNKNGGKYYPCEFCWKKSAKGKLYITEDGRRIHQDKKCKGLKRTIKLLSIKDAKEKGLGLCKKCGK